MRAPSLPSPRDFHRAWIVVALSLLLGMAGGPARAGETRAVDPLIGDTSPRFSADLRASLTERGTAVALDLELPYSELQFIRVPGGYGAVLQITIVFQAAKKNDQVGGDVWEDRIMVPTFEASRDAAARATYRRSFALEPGQYRVDLSVEDQNGGRISRARSQFQVPAFSIGGLGLGDLEFGFCAADSSFVPVPSRRYDANLEAFCVRGVVYDRSPVAAERAVTLTWQVRGESGESLARRDTTLKVTGSAPYVLHPPAANLFLGQYTLEVEAKEGARKWKTERTFDVETLTLPRGQSYETVVEILSYIATDPEYDALRRAKDDSTQQAAWDTFWSRRDPTPETPRNEFMIEIFRRVRFANRTFGVQGLTGWRTDQGRIYIKYGQPDQVEDRPATFYEPPSQIWHYVELKRRYVFVDREGFGRYELINPDGER